MTTADACFDLGEVGQFQPHAKYHHGLDMVVYLAKDCSYTSEPVDGFLTIFWHPHEQRPVGVKLKGFRHHFLEVKDKVGWRDGDFLPLMRFMEAMLEDGLGQELMHEAEKRRKYELAKACVAQIALEPALAREIAQAA